MRATGDVRLAWDCGCAVSVATVVHGDCHVTPPPSKIPEASTAREPEMIRAMLTLKAYTADVTHLELQASSRHPRSQIPTEHDRSHFSAR